MSSALGNEDCDNLDSPRPPPTFGGALDKFIFSRPVKRLKIESGSPAEHALASRVPKVDEDASPTKPPVPTTASKPPRSAAHSSAPRSPEAGPGPVKKKRKPSRPYAPPEMYAHLKPVGDILPEGDPKQKLDSTSASVSLDSCFDGRTNTKSVGIVLFCGIKYMQSPSSSLLHQKLILLCLKSRRAIRHFWASFRTSIESLLEVSASGR